MIHSRPGKTQFASFLLFAATAIIISCESIKEPAPDDNCDGTFVLLQESIAGSNCGQSDGSLAVSTQNSIGEVSFSINGVAQTDGVFENLSAGSYTIEAVDSNGCTAELSITVPNLNGVTAEIAISESDCGTDTGRITITAAQGVEPYTYSIDGGSSQSSNVFDGLAPDSYTVTVTDDTGCAFESQIRVISNIQFSEVNAIIQANCATSGCHDGSQSPNLSTASQIASSRFSVRNRSQQRTMPPAGSGLSLTQAEIDAIVCWVEDGGETN